jgi:hypothetical protein
VHTCMNNERRKGRKIRKEGRKEERKEKGTKA